MSRQNQDSIHALAVPTGVGVLLVPSATIAEVVNMMTLAPIPLASPWLLGAVSWRSLAVPVVSFEALLGKPPLAPAPTSKAIVFYPLTGRSQWEFFAILSSAEPRPQPVDASAIAVAPVDLPQSPYIAAGLKVGTGQAMWIPHFDALKQVFYPV